MKLQLGICLGSNLYHLGGGGGGGGEGGEGVRTYIQQIHTLSSKDTLQCPTKMHLHYYKYMHSLNLYTKDNSALPIQL